MKASIAVVLVLSLLLAASIEVAPSSLPRPLSGFPYEDSKSHPAGTQPTVKCKKGEECCVFGSNPKTDCRLCVTAGHCP